MNFSNKTFRVVFEEKEKQQREREKGVEDLAVSYVDTNRNISVVLESKDLSEDLEEEGFGQDPTAPNSKAFIVL